jgi:hypothetical protein
MVADSKVSKSFSGRGRQWRKQRLNIDGNIVPGHKIECSTFGCPTVQMMPDRGEAGIPPDQVEKRFQRLGWTVGKKSRDDLCPDCTQKAEDERRERGRTRPVSAMAAALGQLRLVVTDQSQGDSVAQPQQVSEDAPRTMSPHDSRIIYDHLSEHYDLDSQCYRAPWTDNAVAQHLGCPLVWVVQVRSQFFGEARDNGEIRQLSEDIAVARAKAEEAIAEGVKLEIEAKQIAGRIINVRGSIDSINRTLEILLKRAEQIVKALGQ